MSKTVKTPCCSPVIAVQQIPKHIHAKLKLCANEEIQTVNKMLKSRLYKLVKSHTCEPCLTDEVGQIKIYGFTKTAELEAIAKSKYGFSLQNLIKLEIANIVNET